jgi:hypothetical protein
MTVNGDGCDGSKTSGQHEPNPLGSVLLAEEVVFSIVDDAENAKGEWAAAKVSWAADISGALSSDAEDAKFGRVDRKCAI